MGSYSRDKLLAELGRDEDRRLLWYWDNAQPRRRSIGIGRNLDDCGIFPDETKTLGLTVASCIAHGITEPQMLVLFWNDVARAEHALDAKLPWWRTLSDARQRVLLNMCFNMGIAKLLGFKDALRAAQAGQFARASTEMLDSDWARQVGDRARRLAGMMLAG